MEFNERTEELEQIDEIEETEEVDEKLSSVLENICIDKNDLPQKDLNNLSMNQVKLNSDYFKNDNFIEDDLIKLAEDVIGEKQNWRNQDINVISEMLHSYDENLFKKLTSNEILKFLRSKCFDYDITFNLIKNYHQLIKINSDYYFQSITKLSAIFSDTIIFVLPALVNQKITIVISPDRYNATKHTYNQFLSGLFHTLERILYNEIAQITGINFIIDLQNFSLTKLKKFSPLNAKKLAFILEECLPIRINGVYVVGSKMVSHLVYALVKPFLSQLLRSKIEFINLNILHKTYSVEVLTKELGGNLPPMNGDKWFLELLRAETLTNNFWNKFISSNQNKNDTLNQDQLDKSENNLLNSPTRCNNTATSSFPFLQILPTCSDYFIPVYK